MIVIGLWLAIIGYGVLYSGVVKLGGGSCSLTDSFTGKCQPSAHTNAATSGSGTTTLMAAQATAAQQAAAVPTTPVPGGSGAGL